MDDVPGSNGLTGLSYEIVRHLIRQMETDGSVNRMARGQCVENRSQHSQGERSRHHQGRSIVIMHSNFSLLQTLILKHNIDLMNIVSFSSATTLPPLKRGGGSKSVSHLSGNVRFGSNGNEPPGKFDLQLVEDPGRGRIAPNSRELKPISLAKEDTGTFVNSYPAFQKADSLRHALSTNFLMQCAALILINKKDNRHYLAHISHVTGSEDILKHF